MHLLIMIKKLHLTCKDKHNITNNVWLSCIQKYKQMYKDYEIIIYDNNDIYNIIQKHYPEHLEKIKKIQIGAILADIFRYLILYLEGGIYADMDTEPIKRIDNLLVDKTYYHNNSNNSSFFIQRTEIKKKSGIKRGYPIIQNFIYKQNPCNNSLLIKDNEYKCLGHNIQNNKVILGYEYDNDFHKEFIYLNSKIRTYKDVGICQWFMISKENRQSVFLKAYLYCIENIDKLLSFKRTDKDYHFNVINTCGPLAFTKIVLDNMDDSIYILPADFFCCGSASLVPRTVNRYIQHHFTGTWL
jgi:hypothetical protein